MNPVSKSFSLLSLAFLVFSACATTVDRVPTAEVLSKNKAFLPSACITAVSPSESPSGSKTEIRERLLPALSTRLNAGLGWGYETAIREGGKTTLVGTGKKSLEPVRPMTEHDPLAIGSVSKMFTGVLIHLAEVEGRLKTSRTLGEIFPELKGTDAGAITLFNLGLHQSGLDRQPPLDLPADNPYAAISPADVLRVLKEWKAPALPAGKTIYDREYSNWGFMTLGLVLEKVYGRPYAEIVGKKVFQPLGMKESAVNQKGKATAGRKRSKAKKSDLAGFSLGGDPLPWWNFVGFVASTGGIESNAFDMAKLLEALDAPPSGNLGQAITRSMDSGIGWDSDPGNPLVWKNGATAANTTILMYDRTKKCGVYIGTNSDFAPDELGAYAIGAAATDVSAARLVSNRVPSAEELSAVKNHFKNVSPVVPELPLTGVYILESLGRMTIRYDFGSEKRSALLLPSEKEGLWNVADGELNIDHVKVMSDGENAKIRLTFSYRQADWTVKSVAFDLEKVSVKPEAYPAQE